MPAPFFAGSLFLASPTQPPPNYLEIQLMFYAPQQLVDSSTGTTTNNEVSHLPVFHAPFKKKSPNNTDTPLSSTP